MITLFLSLLLAGCAAPPRPLSTTIQTDQRPETLIYRGRVQHRGPDSAALFTYERWVEEVDHHQRAVHLTLDAAGAPIVLHEATSTSGQLLMFSETHRQLGLQGQVVVDADHTATFSVSTNGERQSYTEPGGEPVVVGPTLFGFVRTHWDALVDGQTRTLRFAVLKDLRTYRFTARLLSQDEDLTVFELTAVSPLVRAVVPPMQLTYQTDTRAIVRYEGTVPPLQGPADALRPLDARVDYQLLAAIDE